LESIFGGNILYLWSSKLLIDVFIVIILIIELSEIFFDLLSISFGILIIIFLFPLVKPLYFE
jgi:hypothetical protein